MKKKGLQWLLSLVMVISLTMTMTSCGDDDDDDDDDDLIDNNSGQSTTSDNSSTTTTAEIYAMWQPVSIEGTYVFEGETKTNTISAKTSEDAYEWLYFMLFDKAGKVTYAEGTDLQKLETVFSESFTLSGTTLKLGDEVVETYTIKKLDTDNLVIEQVANDGSVSIDDKKCSSYSVTETYKRINNYKVSSK